MRQEFQPYAKNHLVIGILQKLPTEPIEISSAMWKKTLNLKGSYRKHKISFDPKWAQWYHWCQAFETLGSTLFKKASLFFTKAGFPF